MNPLASRVALILALASPLALAQPIPRSSTWADPVPYTPPSEAPATFTLSEAFHWLQGERQRAGLGALKWDSRLATVMRGHLVWLATTSQPGYPHAQEPGTPGFTGVWASDRAVAGGYPTDGRLLGEVLSFQGTADLRRSMEGLASVPYHRMGLLSHQDVDIGCAVTPPAVLDATWSPYRNGAGCMTGRESTASGQAMLGTAGGVSVYPGRGQTGVPPIMLGPESPDPIPEVPWGRGGIYPGYPISVQIEGDKALTVDRFILRDANGKVVRTKLLDFATDPVLRDYLRMRNWAFLVPYRQLRHNHTYTVRFVGKADGTPFSRTWQFTTRGPAEVGVEAVRRMGDRVAIRVQTASGLDGVRLEQARACGGALSTSLSSPMLREYGLRSILLPRAQAKELQEGCRIVVQIGDPLDPRGRVRSVSVEVPR